MPIWRVKYELRYGDDTDRALWKQLTQGDLREVSLVDRPADHNEDQMPTGPTLITDVRFQTVVGAFRLWRLWRGLLSGAFQPPLGVLPLGAAFGNPDAIRGKLSIHNCTHEDSVVESCNTTQYQELVM